MGCPICGSVSLTAVNTHIDYKTDVVEFTEGDLLHIHDQNVRIVTWRCADGHEFEIKGVAPSCHGCTMSAYYERQPKQEHRRVVMGELPDFPRDMFQGPPSAMI